MQHVSKRRVLSLVSLAAVALVLLVPATQLPAAADKVPDDDGNLVEWTPPAANPSRPTEKSRRAPKDSTIRAELVFAMDTSWSMSDEFDVLCQRIGDIVEGVRQAGIDANYRILGITEQLSCAQDTVVDLVRRRGAQPITNHLEDWGPATTDLSRHYPWPSGSVRLVLPLSDESAEDGGWGHWDPPDEAAANVAIEAAVENSVLIMPILCSGYNAGMVRAAQRMADRTHGRYFLSSQPDQDLIDGIVDAILDAVGSVQLTGIGPYWYVDDAWQDPEHTWVNKLPGDIVRLVARVENPTDQEVTARLILKYPARWRLSPGPDGEAVHRRAAFWAVDRPVDPHDLATGDGQVVVSNLPVPPASPTGPGRSEEIVVDLVIPPSTTEGTVQGLRVTTEWDSSSDPDGPRFDSRDRDIGTVFVSRHLDRMIVTSRTGLFRAYGTGPGTDSPANRSVGEALATLHVLASNQGAYLFYVDAWDDHDDFSRHNPACSLVGANGAWCHDDAPIRTWDREAYYGCSSTPSYTCNRLASFTDAQLNAVASAVDDYVDYWVGRLTAFSPETSVVIVGDDRVVPFFRRHGHSPWLSPYASSYRASLHTSELARHDLLLTDNPYSDHDGHSSNPSQLDDIAVGRIVARTAEDLRATIILLADRLGSEDTVRASHATLTSGFDSRRFITTSTFRRQIVAARGILEDGSIDSICTASRTWNDPCAAGNGGTGCLLEFGTSRHWNWANLRGALSGIVAFRDHGNPFAVSNFWAFDILPCDPLHPDRCLDSHGDGIPTLHVWTCLAGLADGGPGARNVFATRALRGGFGSLLAATALTHRGYNGDLLARFYRHVVGTRPHLAVAAPVNIKYIVLPPRSLGRALLMAKREVTTGTTELLQSAEAYTIYGLPWTRYVDPDRSKGHPVSAKAPLVEHIAAATTKGNDPGLVASQELEVSAADVLIETADPFELLAIPGYRQRLRADEPVLPATTIPFTLPRDARVVRVWIEARQPTDLGEVHLPAYRPVPDLLDGDLDPMYVEPSPDLGLFDPIGNPAWTEATDGNQARILVDVCPLTYDVRSRHATLYGELVVHVAYVSGQPGVLLATGTEDLVVGASEPIQAMWTPANTSSSMQEFRAVLRVLDPSGRELARVDDATSLESGHVERRSVPLEPIRRPGRYVLETSATSSKGSIGVLRAEFRVVAGEITGFDVPADAEPGGQARFVIHFANRGADPLEGTFKVLVYRGDTYLGSTVPIVQTTGPGETSDVTFFWDVPETADGEHRAVAVAEFLDTSDTASRAFEVGRNEPPVADAGPDQERECEGPDGTVFPLDGSGSTDPDGDPLTCRWSSGDCTFADATACTTTATCPLGVNTVELVVNDGELDSPPDRATLTVVDTTPPTGRITFPPDGACLPPPVTVADDFTDVCDDELARTWDPGPGPVYDRDGAWDVLLTVEDDAGNVAEDGVSFIVDGTPPVVTVLGLPGMEQSVPRPEPFSKYFATSDEDEAPGGVVRERIYLDGCLAFDGNEYGDGDGLLTDEWIDVPVGLLCHVYRACGWTELVDPVVRIEADDCAGNTGSAEVPWQGHFVVDSSACGGE